MTLISAAATLTHGLLYLAYFLSPNSEPRPVEQNSHLSVVRARVIQTIAFLRSLFRVMTEHCGVFAVAISGAANF